jgi:hypothetical protein
MAAVRRSASTSRKRGFAVRREMFIRLMEGA